MPEIFLSKNIKSARRRVNLSQKDLASQLGISEKTVSAYETGRAIPPSTMLAKISTITKVSLSELAGVTEPVTNKSISDRLDNVENRLSNIEQVLLKLLNK